VEGAVFPLAEWERAGEFSEVVERAAELRAEDYRFEVIGPDAFNRFECLRCRATVEG
jgi:hypothetical protein